ncbi:hypothetical protein [Methylobacterium oxalidis]|uniref:Uncharacterized protein n=1 Tax=Methylobacterium oxalidis TaxID=944322 RepID=A0A512JDX3_9HYPH|nr:hypothetical protein [Methylobacterium oxalidis]GEP08139.1 hypothetical protein MOX02_61770 [Methylobacterium oxalidis]GLS62495.1 hypothetical protein GCM10007888_08760 [Methylobacterium oxalidis]
MRIGSLALSALLVTSLSGAALAQAGTAGSAEKNLNNPGSVKSNTEKGMPAKDGVATTGTATGAAKDTSPSSTKAAPASKAGAGSTGAH